MHTAHPQMQTTRAFLGPPQRLPHAAADAAKKLHCAYRHCFNVIASTNELGAFAGVLTALTFSAIIFLAGRKKEEQPDLEDTLILLFAAFVTMAIATYLYSSASAEEGPKPRSAFLAFCAGLALSTALLLLFLGIVQLIRDGGFREAHQFASKMARWVVGPVIFLFMLVTAVGAHSVNQNTPHAWNSALGFASPILFLALLAWVRLGRSSTKPDTTRKLRRWWIRLTVGIGLVAVALTALWGEAEAHAAIPTAGYLVLILLLLVALCGYSSVLKSLEHENRPLLAT
jgi:hypothetical protein